MRWREGDWLAWHWLRVCLKCLWLVSACYQIIDVVSIHRSYPRGSILYGQL